MILDDTEIEARLESPLNLMNRLKTIHQSVGNTSLSPCLPPKASELIDGLDDKLDKKSMRVKASEILDASMNQLKQHVINETSPKRLAEIAEKMSKVISNSESNGEGAARAQIIIYAPTMVSEDHFNSVVERDVA